MIGNVAGECAYELCIRIGSRKAHQIIADYYQEMEHLNEELDIQLLTVIDEIRKAMGRFDDLEDFAFDMDVNAAFNASIRLAEEVGVAPEKILRTKAQIDNFFLA